MTTIGDTVAFVDDMLGVSASFRVMGESLDMDEGKKTFVIDRTQYRVPFTLDVSKLDETDILT
jgi:hypothetical protein